MAISVIDFSKLEGKGRVETLAQIDNGYQQWGFFQLVNHGIPVELLECVKKVCMECNRHRDEAFKASRSVQLLDQLVREEQEVAGEVNNNKKKLDNTNWEDVFVLQDDNQ
ncbi:hypothetical protein ZIOFF_032921 [Zingiber officinale]|uniref:Non-haem dioxygenase N-terminal domain-containing protein n=1 Tax=Zingiber officinale TaxID=94328 RepID=A0A8J5GJL2_ZINOF|nr:hypothetical protein ZIOFF_032921 [Zingiber officinale]